VAEVRASALKVVIALVAVLASGCATPGKPIADDFTGPRATLADDGFAEDQSKGQLFYVEAIDGKAIDNARRATAEATRNRGFDLRIKLVSREVPARPMKVKLVATHKTAAPIDELTGRVARTHFSVEGVVDFTPSEGRRYVVNGELDPEGSSVWIEDAESHEVATEKVLSAGWKPSKTPSKVRPTGTTVTNCIARAGECPEDRVIDQAKDEESIAMLLLTCGSPYKLTRDCSEWGGATRELVLEGIKVNIGGTADGKVILLMPPLSQYGGATRWTNLAYRAAKVRLDDAGLAVLKIRPVTASGNIRAYLVELDGDGYSVLAAPASTRPK
jgi:hypothetical protein